MNILLVDNDNYSLKYFKQKFESRDVFVSIANNVKDALEIADRLQPDVVISEIILPVINGFEFCKIWNFSNKYNKIPFIFYTYAFFEEEDVEFAKTIGAKTILNKNLPFEIFWESLLKFSKEKSEPIDVLNSSPVTELKSHYKKFLERLKTILEERSNLISSIYKSEIKEEKILDEVRFTSKEFIDNLFHIFDGIPYTIIIHMDGKIIYANNTALQTFEATSKEDMIGKEISQFIHPDYFLIIQERLLRLIDKKENVETIREKLLTVKKNTIDMEVSANVFNYLKNPAVMVIGRDITEELRKDRILNALDKAGSQLLKASTRKEIFEIVSDILSQFGISTVLMLTDEQKENLVVVDKKFDSKKFELLEKFLPPDIMKVEISIEKMDKYHHINSHQSVFRQSLTEVVDDILPKNLSEFSNKILKLLNANKSITTPIFIDDEFIGLFIFLSNNLKKEDIKEFDSFVNQFALAFKNLKVIEQLQKEINMRKQTEIEFKALAEAAQIVIYVFSDNKPAYVNPFALKLSGYTKEEMLKKNYWDLVRPDYRELIREYGQARLRGEKVPSRFRFPILTKDGQTVWLDYSANVVESNGSKIIVGTAIDITQQIVLENELRENKEQFETLVNTTTTAVFVYSGTKFVFVNNATQTLTGYSEEELLNMNFWDVVHPDFKDLIKQRGLARQKGEKIPNNYEFKIVRKDGTECWISFTAGKIVWNGKNASIGTAINIDETKKLLDNLMASQKNN